MVMAGWWAASVAKRGVGGTLRAITIWVLLIALVLVATWGVFSGKFYAWRANVWKDRAEVAAGRVLVERQRADTAETSNTIARDTSERMANVTPIIVYPAEQSAQRIEAKAYEQEAAGRVEPAVDDDILRELAEGRDAYTSAAGGVQRKGSR